MGKRIYKPESVQEYVIATAIEGKSKASAFREIVDDKIDAAKGAKALENSAQYREILQATKEEHARRTNESLVRLRERYYDRYGDLLDETQKSIQEAEKIDDKIKLIQEQRHNLAIPVLASSVVVNDQPKEMRESRFETAGIIE